MPEGDTLKRIARALQVLVGQRVRAFSLPRQAGVGASIAGCVVDEVEAVGKHLVVGFDNGLALHTHLKMTGSWHLYRRGAPWQRPASTAVAVIDVDDGADGGRVAVCFKAPTCRLVERRRLERELVDLRPVDLLGEVDRKDADRDDEFDLDAVIARLRARDHVPLGVALLDQGAVAGIGNVYKSEGLFRARLDPFAPVSAVDDARLRALLLDVQALMKKNVERGGMRTTTTNLPSRAAVYGREGLACFSCGALIRMQRQGELLRSTYFCPVCQPPM